MTQLYFFVTFVCTEYILLAVMAFDRYVAICNPLRYPVIMTNQLCGVMAGGCWFCGLMTAMIKMVFIARLRYCGTPHINHYFCDIKPLLKLVCKDVHVVSILAIVNSGMVLFAIFIVKMKVLQDSVCCIKGENCCFVR